MLFGVSVTDAIHTVGVIGILAIVFAESGMLVGFLLPGDTLLFSAGFLTQQGALGINVHLLVALVALAAIAGDNVGYLLGHKLGRRLFKKPNSILFRQENLQRAEQFYEKFGPLTVLIARFIPMVRSFAPIVSGIGSMRYPTFLLFDIGGGIAWSASMIYLGYYGGAFLESKGINVETLVMPIVLLAVLVSFLSPLYHILKQKESREALLVKLRLRKRA